VPLDSLFWDQVFCFSDSINEMQRFTVQKKKLFSRTQFSVESTSHLQNPLLQTIRALACLIKICTTPG
jgi:hypothetical protein